MHLTAVLAALLLASSLQAQKRPSKPKAKPAPEAAPAPTPAPAPEPAALPKPRVKLETSYGPIILELEPELAPKTVANFLGYVKSGHYAGTIFHRVIPGFMVQGGGHLEDMSEKPAGAPIPNEGRAAQKAGLKNVRGTVAMARQEDPHSASAQFYINTADNASLDAQLEKPDHYGYTVFGRVIEGMAAVDRIEKVQTVWRRGMQNVPEYAVRIKGAAVVEAQP